MDEKLNMFIEPIINKKEKHNFKNWLKLKKLLKMIKHTSPDYNMLTEIYRFLILLQNIYMYNNNSDHYLFSATVPKGYDAAFIYQEKGFSIKFLLRDYDKYITIGICRDLQRKTESTTISFKDGECVINNKYEEETFVFIIACLMSGLSELIIYYYKNKKF